MTCPLGCVTYDSLSTRAKLDFHNQIPYEIQHSLVGALPEIEHSVLQQRVLSVVHDRLGTGTRVVQSLLVPGRRGVVLLAPLLVRVLQLVRTARHLAVFLVVHAVELWRAVAVATVGQAVLHVLGTGMLGTGRGTAVLVTVS